MAAEDADAPHNRSVMRIAFRIAQVTVLLWAVVVLVERYVDTAGPGDAPREEADLIRGDQAFADDFDSLDGPLDGRNDWSVITGDWSVNDGAAHVATESGGAQPSLAVHEVQNDSRVVIQTTIESTSEGLGLAWAFEDPTSFMRLTLNPSFAGAAVESIVNGSATKVATYAPIEIPDSYQLTLEFSDGELQIWVGGAVIGNVPTSGPGPMFGLSSAAGAPGAFDEIRVYVGS